MEMEDGSSGRNIRRGFSLVLIRKHDPPPLDRRRSF